MRTPPGVVGEEKKKKNQERHGKGSETEGGLVQSTKGRGNVVVGKWSDTVQGSQLKHTGER